MSRGRADLVMAAMLLAIAVLLLVETLAMGRVARRVPEPVVLVTLALLVLQVLSALFPAVARIAGAYSAQPAVPGMEMGDGSEEAVERPPGWRESVSGLLWVVALPVLVVTAGLVPSTFLYALVYFRFRGEMRWLPALTAAVALSAGLYVLLERVLGVMLHRGPLPWP